MSSLDQLPEFSTSRSLPRRKKRSGVGQIIGIVLGAVTAVGLYYTPPVQRFMRAMREVMAEDQHRPADHAAKTPALPEIVDRVEPSVLRLKVVGQDGERSGSCFVAADFCVTNFHVLANALSARAYDRDGREIGILGCVFADPLKDIVILQLNGKLPSLRLATKYPNKGEQVFVFGAPRGIAFSVSSGVVNNLVRGVDGKDPNTTWIVHQAPISPGNSGGPLVNQLGELVGMNTFFDRGGQNLNFAMSAFDIASVLKGLSSWDIRPLSELPKDESAEAGRQMPAEQPKLVPQEAPAPPAAPRQLQEPWKIVLPSGTWLAEDQFEFGTEQIAELFPKDAKKAVFHHDNKKVRAMLGYDSPKLHGGMAIFDQAGEPHIVGQFEAGKRQGVLQVFANGERVLWRTFRNDTEDGLTCMFVDGRPRLVQEYKLGKPIGEYVIEYRGDKVAAIALEEAQEEGAQLKSAIDAIEADVATIEAAIKRELAKWCREQEKLEFERKRQDLATADRIRSLQWAAEAEAQEAAANDALMRTIIKANTPYQVRWPSSP